MAFTNIEVTGTFTDASGKNLQGKVTAVLSTTIQNADKTVEPAEVKAPIVNGKLSMKLVANNDTETLPTATFYTFKVEAQRAKWREFKAQVPHTATAGKIDISELYENSGMIGVSLGQRPTLSQGAHPQEIVEALRILGLIEWVPISVGEHNMIER